jgi:signal transduction histidine kinase
VSFADFLPRDLARRFALAAAGLAACAVLLTTGVSSWIIKTQHAAALQELAAKERHFHAAAVASDLNALAERMAEVAASTILATGLVDSAGRETYLAPFLGGLRQINGVPVQVLFTDFEGKEIANNGSARFSEAQLAWMKEALAKGQASASIFSEAAGDYVVAIEPLVYRRTRSPEGALLYKFSIADIRGSSPMQLEWNRLDAPRNTEAAPFESVAAPPVFAPLQFRVRTHSASAGGSSTHPYAAVIITAAILFVAVVVAGVHLAHVLTRHLRELQAFATHLIGSGLGTERAPIVGTAETAELARSINEMLDRLSEQHCALLRDREKLTDLTQALQAADRRKDDFLAMLAHELRNPLAPMKSSLALMKLKPLPDPQLARARDVADRQMNHMSRLLDDLLDVSRITQNKLELRKERIDIARVIEAAVETSQPVIDQAGQRLRLLLPPQPLYLDADPLRLSQVFANLLNNAARYSPSGGCIEVRAQAQASDIVVIVKDEGNGISPQYLPHIFEMFMQTASLSDAAQFGLGIGLSLVRSLVEMHGGSVTARSEAWARVASSKCGYRWRRARANPSGRRSKRRRCHPRTAAYSLPTTISMRPRVSR